LFEVAITSQVVFQKLVQPFYLAICLKMECNVQPLFYYKVMAKCRPKLINKLSLSDIIPSGNPKEQKTYSKNKVAKPSTINYFVINIYKVYLMNR